MSRNKLVWIFALILAVILSLPIAHAQAASGNRWMFIAINAAVIGVVLFLLQAVLVPQKPDKEKISMWVIVIIASLVIAYLYGQNGLIWKTGPFAKFFSLYVLVNSIIIGAVIYFVLGLLPIGKNLISPEGNRGYIILIFVVSVAIAVNLSPERFLWHQETLRSLYNYLLSGQEIARKDGTKVAAGVFHYNGGLFVFITGFMIIYFFLQNYLLKQGNWWLNLGMAGLFAFVMATPPASPLKDVVLMGELFFIFIFWEALKASIGQGKYMTWVSLGLAVFIVAMISAAITVHSPDNRGVLGSIGCNWVPFIGPDCEDANGMTTRTGQPVAAAGGDGWGAGAWIKLIFLLLAGAGGIVSGINLYKKYKSGTVAPDAARAAGPAPVAHAEEAGPATPPARAEREPTEIPGETEETEGEP